MQQQWEALYVPLFVQDYSEQTVGAITIVMKNPGLESIGILLRGSLYTLNSTVGSLICAIICTRL